MPKPKSMPIFVVDTNIAIDYPDIIPNGENSIPNDPTVDTSKAHIVVPTAVIRELSKFKNEPTDRGRSSREVLRRVRTLVENKGLDIDKVYALDNPIEVKHHSMLFSILSVNRDFQSKLSFTVSNDDWDGQIIVAALMAKEHADNAEVTILTNDNGLAIRAAARGLSTSRYGYRYPAPYTGRRDLEVPFDLYHRWAADDAISLKLWQEFMPEQPPLIANEFLIMQPVDWSERIPYFENIGRYDVDKTAIVPLAHIRNFPLTIKHPGHACYIEALYHPDISAVIATGPAGSGKTFMASIYGYEACKSGDYIGVVVVPCRARDDGVGYLPGDLDEKLDPNVQPIKNSLRNYLIQTDPDYKRAMGKTASACSADDKKKDKDKPEKSVKKRLAGQVNEIWENWFDNIAIAHAGGRDFAYQVALYDEFQDQSRREADTLIKRIGVDGKIIITGDIEQVHAAYLDSENNGLVYARQQLMDLPMVAQITFTEDEVVRHPLVKIIAQRQRAAREAAKNPVR
ncbi:PhoH family protein [Candidatus Saccharibacteria bacterium]|nr:PhoH family protein [Candidatus Saccharibacteria bacterium]